MRMGLVVGVSLGLVLTAPVVVQTQTMLLWPKGAPEASSAPGPEMDPTTDKDRMVRGKVSVRVTNVSAPTLALYPADAAKNTGAAAVVFPGGGYVRLSMTLEGTERCGWLNSIGVNCVVVKCRVPEKEHYPENTEDLEDAQQAMRLVRMHAAEWHIDPAKIGTIGFSAGAHLAAVLGTHPDFQGKGVPASAVDARPAFQMIIYPGYVVGPDGKCVASLLPNAGTPPTFLLQAENDYAAHVESALAYFQALKEAKVPAELHVYTLGGHGFGLRATDLPIGEWPKLAETWLHTIHVLGQAGVVGRP